MLLSLISQQFSRSPGGGDVEVFWLNEDSSLFSSDLIELNAV